MSQTPPPSEPTSPVPPAPEPVAAPEPSPAAPAAQSAALPSYGQQQPAYAQQPAVYGQPAVYAGGGYPPVQNPTNTLAIISLVASLAGIFFWFIAPVAGVITGHIALSQIKKTGQQGRGLALAGVIVGYVLAGLTALGVIAYIVFIVAVLAAAGSSGSFDTYGS